MGNFTPGLSGLAGFAEGFANSWGYQKRLELENEIQRRHDLASVYTSTLPNARPEAQPEILSRLASIYTTPINKKLDKSVTDIQGLFQPPQQFGQGMQMGGTPGPVTQSIGEMPPQQPLALPPGMQGPPQLAPQQPPQVSAAPSTGTVPQLGNLQPPPTSGITNYTPTYQPEERAQQAAYAKGQEETATLGAFQNAYANWQAQNPGGSIAEFLAATGKGVPYGAFQPKTLSMGVVGSQIPPNTQTFDGKPIDPNGIYDLKQDLITGQPIAYPPSMSSQLGQLRKPEVQAQTANAQARLPGIQASTQLAQGRVGMLPLQTAKLAQDLQLNPEKVELARANSVGRWFGPTAAGRQAGQFASDVEDKIDAVEPLISQLAAQGRLGPLQGRLEDFLAGRIHVAEDPNGDIANLRNQLDVLSKAIMRMHGFRSPEEADRFLAQNLAIGSDPELLMGSLEGLRTAARTYEGMAQLPPEIQTQMQKAFGTTATPQGTNRLTPPPAASSAPTAKGGAAPSVTVGQKVSIKGKQMTVTAVHPDGSFDAK